jgi:hypothetical protein
MVDLGTRYIILLNICYIYIKLEIHHLFNVSFFSSLMTIITVTVLINDLTYNINEEI